MPLSHDAINRAIAFLGLGFPEPGYYCIRMYAVVISCAYFIAVQALPWQESPYGLEGSRISL